METFIFSSAAILQMSEVTELFLLDGRTTEKGETRRRKKKQKRGSEVGSRHHLLQMFAPINLLRSSCTVHVAAEVDNQTLESAKGA